MKIKMGHTLIGNRGNRYTIVGKKKDINDVPVVVLKHNGLSGKQLSVSVKILEQRIAKGFMTYA